jgi:hypothetical protein
VICAVYFIDEIDAIRVQIFINLFIFFFKFCRSAFFEGVIEKPCHKVKKALMGCQQTEVLCAINTDGITVIDKEKPVSSSSLVTENHQRTDVYFPANLL